MEDILKAFGITTEQSGISTGKNWLPAHGADITSVSPVNNKKITTVKSAAIQDQQSIGRPFKDREVSRPEAVILGLIWNGK